MSTYHFIINPKSRTGKGIKVWQIVEKKLKELGIQYTYYFTHYEFHATKIATEICNTHPGLKRIVVLGGDGTVNEVINGIETYEEVLLGYIPSGSSNDLARSIGIPKDPLKALDRILNSTSYPCYDHGLMTFKDNKVRKFAVSTGIGFDASVCNEALNSKVKQFFNKIKLGKLTYGLIAIKQLIKYQPNDVTVIIDGQKQLSLKRVFFIATLIHKYEGGGFMMAPKALPSDQRINVCLVNNVKKWMVLFILPSMLFGKHTNIKGVKTFECNSLDIITEEPLIVHTDGEIAGRSSNLSISCTKSQIQLML